MSVKDVLQSLVDDGMVDSDRIGTSNYFWAFPSKAANQVPQSLRLYCGLLLTPCVCCAEKEEA